jgi:hypothetical protein
MIFYLPFREVKALCDLTVCAAMKTAQQEHISRRGRQRGEGRLKRREALFVIHFIHRRRRRAGNGNGIVQRRQDRRAMLLLPQIIERQIEGGSIQEGSGMADLLRLSHAEQTKVRILGQIRRRMPAPDHSPQATNQVMLMGLEQALDIERRRVIHVAVRETWFVTRRCVSREAYLVSRFNLEQTNRRATRYERRAAFCG